MDEETAQESEESTAEPVQPLDPVSHIQNAVAESVTDGSLLTGYVLVAEWIEADGSCSMSVIHTPMPPWHFYGLITYGRESFGGQMLPVMAELGDDDDDDDEDDF